MNGARTLAAAVALLTALLAEPSAAQQAPAVRPPARPATRPATADAPADTTRLEYMREVFNYQGGSRDPFQTLISSGDVRPTIADLRLMSIIYDPGGNSVAMVSEAVPSGPPKSHRLRRGSQIGRLHVIQIQQFKVVFQIEEFGFERQQELTLVRREANP